MHHRFCKSKTTFSLSLSKATMPLFSPTCWVATISLLKLPFHCQTWSSWMEPQRSIQARNGKLGRPLPWSSPVEVVQATLRINIVMLLALSSFSSPRVILWEIYSTDVVIVTLWTVYLTVVHTCDLSILSTHVEASVHLFRNRGMTGGIRANVDHRMPT
jgi:hypothetical protein